MFSKLLAVACIGMVYAVDGPGLGGSLTQEGVNEAKVIVAPYIFKSLQDVEVPEVDFDGGKLTNIKVSVPQPDLSNINIQNVDATNGIDLTAKGVTINAVSDFTFKYLFITATGQATIKIKNAGLDTEIDISTQPGKEQPAELAPSVKVGKLDISVNPDDVDITLTGSLVSKIANILIPLLKSSVLPNIIDQAKQTATQLIDTTVEQDLAEYGIQTTIPYLAGVTFDYGQMNQGPKINNGVFNVAFNGTFFDIDKIHAPTVHPATFDTHDPKGKQLQGYLTDYVLNTMFSSGFETGNTLDITYLLKTYLNTTVTTDTLGSVISEIVDKYGSGKPVSITGKWVTAPTTSSFKTTGQTLDGSILVTVSVDNEQAILAQFDNFSAAAKLNSSDGKIYGKIDNAVFGTIGDNFQNTLNFTADKFLQRLQMALDLVVMIENDNLRQGVVIPKIMGVDVSDVEINFFDGYLALGLSVNQQFWLAFRDRMNWAAKEIKNMKTWMKGVAPESVVLLQA